MSARRPATTSTGSRALRPPRPSCSRWAKPCTQLLQALAADYGQEPAYQVAARLFSEQYRVVAETTQAKANQEISASSLQSLDDLEATYREKNRVGYKGYVANVTETCDPENALQLITDVQVAPNTTEDDALLAAALPELKQRTDLDTLYTDGAYGGPAERSGVAGTAGHPDPDRHQGPQAGYRTSCTWRISPSRKMRRACR